MLNAWILKGPLTPACYIIAGQVDCSQQGKTALGPPGKLRWAVCSRGVSHLLSFVKKHSFFLCFVLLFTFICALYMYFCLQNIYFYFVLVYQVISLVGLIYIWLFFSCLLTLSKTPELCQALTEINTSRTIHIFLHATPSQGQNTMFYVKMNIDSIGLH